MTETVVKVDLINTDDDEVLSGIQDPYTQEMMRRTWSLLGEHSGYHRDALTHSTNEYSVWQSGQGYGQSINISRTY